MYFRIDAPSKKIWFNSTYLSILNLLRLQRAIFWGRIQANVNQITAALIPKLGQENPH